MEARAALSRPGNERASKLGKEDFRPGSSHAWDAEIVLSRIEVDDWRSFKGFRRQLNQVENKDEEDARLQVFNPRSSASVQDFLGGVVCTQYG
jgi:hypothetical protein